MVDLDGARSGKPENSAVFLRVARESGLKVQLGGGIRDLETISHYLESGIERIVLGTAAIRNPDLVRRAAARYPERIAVGIDAREGRVMVEGWLAEGSSDYLSLAKQMEETGVKYLIFTDISRDGALAGPNLEQLQALQAQVSLPVIASGGVKNIDDIKALGQAGVYGAICGKSLYEGTLDLKEAISEANK
jgi:phosphoribosylformimino-5-aminoimidazole carboxamide ribotide isomerase